MSRVHMRVLAKEGSRTIIFSAPEGMAHQYLAGVDYDEAAIVPDDHRLIGSIAQIIAFKAQDTKKPRGIDPPGLPYPDW